MASDVKIASPTAMDLEQSKKVHFHEKTESHLYERSSFSGQHFRRMYSITDTKLRLPTKFHGRKRSRSFCSLERESNKTNHYKQRKFNLSDIVPPTKFLLGGNISDPLNLNGLTDEKSMQTPESSPFQTPKHKEEEIQVLIPPNIRDPLNLNGKLDDDFEKSLISPKKKKKHKMRKKHASDGGKMEEDFQINLSNSGENETKQQEASVSKDKPENVSMEKPEPPREKKPHKDNFKDRIVSPVIPQPGARKWSGRASFQENDNDKMASWRRRRSRSRSGGRVAGPSQPKFKANYKKFQYGNYNRYYGYRNTGFSDDRLKCFNKEWFCGKDVLDVGCNIGHVTLMIARDWQPKKIVGMDIDGQLIQIARKNIRHYYPKPVGERQRDFPTSMQAMYGPLVPLNVPETTQDATKFPHNVIFVQGNYVLDSDEMLELVRPEFDCITCLSTIKWIHLNFGDAGVKRVFRRMFLQLRPGGCLILELQAWPSYKKKKKLTETIWKNFQAIRLMPDKFTEFLLSEVGFSRCELIGTPHHHSQGFRRPIFLFTKSSSTTATPAYNTSPMFSMDTHPAAVSTKTSPAVAAVSERRTSVEEIRQETAIRQRFWITPPSEHKSDYSSKDGISPDYTPACLISPEHKLGLGDVGFSSPEYRTIHPTVKSDHEGVSPEYNMGSSLSLCKESVSPKYKAASSEDVVLHDEDSSTNLCQGDVSPAGKTQRSQAPAAAADDDVHKEGKPSPERVARQENVLSESKMDCSEPSSPVHTMEFKEAQSEEHFKERPRTEKSLGDEHGSIQSKRETDEKEDGTKVSPPDKASLPTKPNQERLSEEAVNTEELREAVSKKKEMMDTAEIPSVKDASVLFGSNEEISSEEVFGVKGLCPPVPKEKEKLDTAHAQALINDKGLTSEKASSVEKVCETMSGKNQKADHVGTLSEKTVAVPSEIFEEGSSSKPISEEGSSSKQISEEDSSSKQEVESLCKAKSGQKRNEDTEKSSCEKDRSASELNNDSTGHEQISQETSRDSSLCLSLPSTTEGGDKEPAKAASERKGSQDD